MLILLQDQADPSIINELGQAEIAAGTAASVDTNLPPTSDELKMLDVLQGLIEARRAQFQK